MLAILSSYGMELRETLSSREGVTGWERMGNTVLNFFLKLMSTESKHIAQRELHHGNVCYDHRLYKRSGRTWLPGLKSTLNLHFSNA